MKSTYKGVETIISDKLFEATIVNIKPPQKSMKFGNLSLYYDGKYYFPEDIKSSTQRDNKPYEIQAVYYQGKWYQDTFYITEELKNILQKAL